MQDVVTGAVTYGHRFLTTSGRAGRAIKVRTFDEYRARLLENFVILERSERHNKIARELDAKAQRLKGRVSRVVVHGGSGLLQEVPDLVEYPSVIAGTFAPEFTDTLPEEVLTTTLIHHQHYFPVEGEDGQLKPAFLAVINTEPDNERTIARNAERVVTARLRDALFFWESDRKTPLDARVERLSTLVFHKKLGTYKEKSERIERLARWIATEAFGAPAEVGEYAARAARLAKADLATDMVREFTELQGTMGGIYARAEGLPEEVWKAIYFHYLPIGVEADAPPIEGATREGGDHLGRGVARGQARHDRRTVRSRREADRLARSVRPYGVRRTAHARFWWTSPELTGRTSTAGFGSMLRAGTTRRSASLDSGGLPIALVAFLTGTTDVRPRASRGFDIRRRCEPSRTIASTISRRTTLRRKLEVLARVHRLAGFPAARRCVQACEEHR